MNPMISVAQGIAEGGDLIRVFEITREEQFWLGTNLVSLTPETVISENRLNRINAFFRNEGFDVITTDYSEVAKLGGLFRCSTCPMVRS